MSNSRLFIFLAVVVTVFVSVLSQEGENPCNRPKATFENIKHVHDYLKCIKSQASTRYGKRALSPPLLGKLRPDLYNDYENNLQQVYDMLYADN